MVDEEGDRGRQKPRALPGRMNPTDAALWDIERDPSLRTTIVCVMVLAAPCSFPRVRDRLAVATELLPRLRHVVHEPPGGVGVPSWAPDPAFDLDYHVRHVRVPPPADLDAVLALAAPMASGDFDRSRPVWELVYADGLDDGGAAVLLKVHHSLTDGVGGIGLLDALLDLSADAPLPEPPVEEPTEQQSSHSPAAELGRRAREATDAAVGALRDPVGTARRTAALVPSTLRMLGPTRQPRSPLMTGRGRGRRLAAFEVPTAGLRAAGQVAGGTLNDAFVAAVLSGAARYHEHHAARAPALRFTMPVNLRRADHDAGGNQWAPARFDLPTGIADPVVRMRHIHDVVTSWRREPALGINQTLAGLVQQLPGPLSATVVAQMMRGVDVIVSNVPGLQEPRWFVGSEVRSMFAMAPTAGAACNVTLVTHRDAAGVGIAADTEAIPDLGVLVECLRAGFDEILAVAEDPDALRIAALVHGEDADATETASATDAEQVGAPRPVPRIERLSFLDAGFLRAEGPRTPMNLGAVLLLDGGPLTDAEGRLRLDDIRRHISARLERIPRFTRRLVDLPLGGAYWVDHPALRIEDHVLEVGIPAPGSMEQLLEVAADIHAMPLDRNRPLWELWFAAGLEDGRVAIVEKAHHALLDGISGVEFIGALLDLEPSTVVEEPPWRDPDSGPSLLDVVRHATVTGMAAPAATTRSLVRAVSRPGRLAEQLATMAGVFGDAARPVRGGPLHRPVGSRRRLHSLVLPRAELERARGKKGATLNDVVLTLVSGGLRSLDLETDEELRDMRAAVPVSQRRSGMDHEPGNRVSLVLVPLPVSQPNPRRRLSLVATAMRRAKEQHRGEGVDLLFDVLDHLPAATGAVVPIVHHQRFADVVVTNVPGSPVTLWFLGAELQHAIPVVPLLGNTDLAVAVLSYRDEVCIALHTDPELCPRADAVIDGMRADLAVLAPPRAKRTRRTTP